MVSEAEKAQRISVFFLVLWYLWLLAIAGIALSVLWEALITSYRNLNTAKFAVIHKIEKRLPISPYEAEWEASRTCLMI